MSLNDPDGQIAPRIFGKIILILPLILAGCAANPESATRLHSASGNVGEYSGERGDEVSYWDDQGTGGNPKIVVDLNEQRAYFYRGPKIVGISVVSTGREGYKTPSGNFSVIEKDPTHASSIYGEYVDRSGQILMENVDLTKDSRPRGAIFQGAPMPYFLRINGGIGMHAGYLPGYPASHGCIRLPKEMAVRFFLNAAIGTPVIVCHAAPGEYGANPVVRERYEPFASIMEWGNSTNRL
jgi:hypothetical protein